MYFYVYDLFHILLSISQTYGSIMCVYVCMYVYMNMLYTVTVIDVTAASCH